jgi:hypothetical protein
MKSVDIIELAMLLISRKRIVRTKTEIIEVTAELVQSVELAVHALERVEVSRKVMKRPTLRKVRSDSKKALAARRQPK